MLKIAGVKRQNHFYRDLYDQTKRMGTLEKVYLILQGLKGSADAAEDFHE